MQNTSQSLVNILSSSTRDFVPVDLIEFYDPSTTELVPGLAVKRFANTALVWYGWEYEQQAVSRGSTARYIDERFNTVSLTFSNVDRSLSEWLSSVSVAGYRVLIRAVSRSVTGDSIVLFIGRVEKAFSVTNTSVSLTIKQDLGSINSELPARKFSHACPLKFKGKDCLGGQAITAKTQRYQNATTCDKSWQQCRTYGNSIFFQGFRTTNVTGSFVLRDKSSFGIPTKSTKQWSSQDATPINEHVPMGLGRTQIELTPIASADTGQYLYGHWVAGEGPIAKFKNVRNVTPGFARRFEGQADNGEPSGTGSYREHLGTYGDVAGQQSASNFLGTVHYSGRAYIEGTIRGQNPDTGDPAPSIVSTVLWNPIPTAQGSTKYEDASPDWSDNPVDHVRYILTHERGLQYPVEMVNDEVAIETAKYCDDPLYDKSGGEDLVVGQTDDVLYGSFTAGRFRSTGLIDPFFWRRRMSSSAPYSAERLANITYFPVTEFVTDEFGQQVERHVPPPDNFTPNEYFRKRYTANWHLKKGVKVADFLFKQLLPSFQGYLVTGADGRLQIRTQRSAVQSRSSGTVTPAMNTIDVYDGKQFIDLNLPIKYVLIQSPGFPQDGNIRQIVGIDYLTAANAITIGPPSSGAGTMNCVIWGADPNTQAATTFSGGSTQYQAFAYIMVTSGLTQNATAGVRIDGVDVGAGGPVGDTAGYTNNWSAEIAAMIATNLNANPNLRNANGIPLRDYIEAIWEPSNPLMVLFRSKQATLILDRPFDGTFPINALVTHFHLPFSDGSDGRPSAILKDSFEWPLGGRQSTYNQFSITYQDSVQDSQSINVLENDYDHQEATNQVNKLDVPGGECVDNYHQADRLLLAARYKYREGDFFVQFQTAGLAMLLEEGDLILVNHSSMPAFKNYLYRIEELSISQDHRVTITARLYADTQYPEQPVPKTIPLTRSNDWQTAVAPPVRSFSIERLPNSGNAARVTIGFPQTVAPVTVRVLVRRLNVEANPPVYIDENFVDTGIVVVPGENNIGQFELAGITTGSQVQFVPVTSTGIEGAISLFTVPNLPTDTGTGTGVTESQMVTFKNRLINGSFVIDQRNNGATTPIADDVYCFDRWYILSQTSSVQVVRQTDTANGIPTNIRITQNQPSAQRCGIAQIIESINCRDLRGQSVVLRFNLRCSVVQPIRYAILEWTGTADTNITSDIVNSWTNGTFTTGQFFNSTTLRLVGTGSTTPSTGNWETATALTGTVSSSANNLIVFIWSEGTLAQNATLDLAKVQLERGSTATEFEVLPINVILSQCQRYLPMWDARQPTAVLADRLFGGTFSAVVGPPPANAILNRSFFWYPYPAPPRVIPTAIAASAVTDFWVFDCGAGGGPHIVQAIGFPGGGAYGNQAALLIADSNTALYTDGAVCFVSPNTTNAWIRFEGCEL